MSNLTHIPEDLRSEFRVESDGKTYISFRALSRLCGASESGSSIATLLQRVALAKSKSKSLEPLQGQDYEALADKDKGIPDTVATLVINHFAESGRKEAIQTLTAFSAIGFRTWVQNELGYSEQKQTEMLNQILTELQELKETQKKYNSISDRVDDQQGLKEILADYEADKQALNSDYYTLRSWLDEKGIQLNNRALRKLANRVAHTYRTHYREAPRQVRAYKAGEEGKTNLVNVYRVSDEPLIRAAFKQCFR